MEACSTDPGASSCLEAQRTTMALRSVWQTRIWWGCEGEAGTDRLCGTPQVRTESSQVREEICRTIRELKSMHEAFACFRPKENRFLGSPKLFTAQAWAMWRQSYQVDNCDRAGLAELGQTVMRLRMAEAQPTNPDDKKHLLPRSGEVTWCWRCGARVERNSAPRLLLKTASRQTEEPCVYRATDPISDEEWNQWHQDHCNLFFLSARVAKFLSLPPCLLRAHAPASRVKEDDRNNQTTKQPNKQTNRQPWGRLSWWVSVLKQARCKRAEAALTVLSLSSFHVRVMSYVLDMSASHCMIIWFAHHLHVTLHVTH